MNRSIIFYICAALIGLSIFNSYCKGKEKEPPLYNDGYPFENYDILTKRVDTIPYIRGEFKIINRYFRITDTLGEVVAEKQNDKWDIPDCVKAMETVEYLHNQNWKEKKYLLERILELENKIKKHEENLYNSDFQYANK